MLINRYGRAIASNEATVPLGFGGVLDGLMQDVTWQVEHPGADHTAGTG